MVALRPVEATPQRGAARTPAGAAPPDTELAAALQRRTQRQATPAIATEQA